MDRKTFSIIMGIALVVGFFLPLTLGVSAFDLVKSGAGDWQKYLWLIIPVCGLLLLLGELNNNYAANRGLITWLPLLTILFFLIISPLINKVAFGDIFKNIGKGWGAGLWVMVIVSVVLAFYNPRPR